MWLSPADSSYFLISFLNSHSTPQRTLTNAYHSVQLHQSTMAQDPDYVNCNTTHFMLQVAVSETKLSTHFISYCRTSVPSHWLSLLLNWFLQIQIACIPNIPRYPLAKLMDSFLFIVHCIGTFHRPKLCKIWIWLVNGHGLLMSLVNVLLTDDDPCSLYWGKLKWNGNSTSSLIHFVCIAVAPPLRVMPSSRGATLMEAKWFKPDC